MYHEAFRQAAIRLYNFFGSMRRTATVLGKHQHSVIVKHRKLRSTVVSDAMKASVHCFMSSKTRTSSLQVVQHIQDVFGFRISRQLAHVIIRRQGFTYKRTRKRGIPSKQQSPNTFFAALKHHRVNIVAIDESGFDQRPIPIYGYAKSGQPAIVQWKPSSDRRRLNLLMAIHVDGTSSHVLHDKPINSQSFVEFIKGMPFGPGTAILLDNASIHKTKASMEASMDCMTENGYLPIFLPPYSPEYNPIELVFGMIKNAFYKLRYSCDDKTLDTMVNDCMNDIVTPTSIQRCFRHVYDLVHKEAQS